MGKAAPVGVAASLSPICVGRDLDAERLASSIDAYLQAETDASYRDDSNTEPAGASAASVVSASSTARVTPAMDVESGDDTLRTERATHVEASVGGPRMASFAAL